MDENHNAPATVKEFQELATFVGEKFDKVEGRLDRVELRLDKVEIKIDNLDKKLDKKFDTALTGIDKILQFSEAQKQENIVGAYQIRRHTDTLDDHEKRIKTLELQPQE